MIPATIAALTTFNYWNNRRIASTYYKRITPLLFAFKCYFENHKDLLIGGAYAFRDYHPAQGDDPVKIELSTLPYNTLPTKIVGIIALIITTCLLITKKCSPSTAAVSTIWSGFITFYKIREQNKLYHLKQRMLELSQTRWQFVNNFWQLEFSDHRLNLCYILKIENRVHDKLAFEFFRKALLDFTLKNYSFSHSIATKARSLDIPIIVEKYFRTVVFDTNAAQKYRNLKYRAFQERLTRHI